MSIEKLFENRKLIGQNILKLIKDRGYTKSSFSRLIDISRPTIDSLIKGEVDNLSTFNKHIGKILKSQNMNEEQLYDYIPNRKESQEFKYAYSDNAPENYELNSQAKKMFEVLDDVIHLCELYYK